MKRYRGWVSVPVLLLVIMLSALLVHHQRSLNDSHLWNVQRSLQQPQVIWQEIYQTLLTLPVAAGGHANCAGFCRPKDGHWQSRELSFGNVWLQKQRIELFHVERWCATRDQQRVRCWWQHDSGQQNSMWLAY